MFRTYFANLIVKHVLGNFLVVQWLELRALIAVAWVQSQVRELMSYKPRGTVKKKKKSFINAKIEAENLISKIIITALRNQGDR